MNVRHQMKAAGEQIRDWRQIRRLSQMELALDAGISTRHLSFIETGRSNASRETLSLLAEELEVPLRERNHLFIAAGFARPIPSCRSIMQTSPQHVRPST